MKQLTTLSLEQILLHDQALICQEQNRTNQVGVPATCEDKV